MKKVKYILIGLFLMIFTPTIAFASTPKMQCTYTGSIPGVDSADIGIRVTITLEANNHFSISSPVLTTPVEGCRSGDAVSDCFKVMNGAEFKVDSVNIAEIKNGYYSLVTDASTYDKYFVKGNKYRCPDTIAMLKHKMEGNYTYSFFLMSNTSNVFSANNCLYNEINGFSCSNHSILTTTGSKVESDYSGPPIGGSGNPGSEIDFGDKVEVNCEGIIGQEMLDFLNKIFRWIQILAPIFVIIISTVDFAGAILQDDKDAMKKATSKLIKRLIIAVALFFIPLILSWLLEMFNDITGAASSTCGIGE